MASDALAPIIGLSPLATRCARPPCTSANVSRSLAESMATVTGVAPITSDRAHGALAKLLASTCKAGRVADPDIIDHDVQALCAPLLDKKLPLSFVANCDVVDVPEDVRPALAPYFVAENLIYNNACVFETLDKTFFLHKETSGNWRIGSGIGHGATVAFSSTIGGTSPPIDKWLDSHGGELVDLLVVHHAVWASLVADAKGAKKPDMPSTRGSVGHDRSWQSVALPFVAPPRAVGRVHTAYEVETSAPPTKVARIEPELPTEIPPEFEKALRP